MPKSATVCLDYFNETVLCISTCSSRQHLVSHEPVCDLPLRKWAVHQRCFEIECDSVSHVAHANVQFLCQEGIENSECGIKCIERYTIASNTLKCKAVDFKTALGTVIGNVSYTSKSCGVPSSIANALHTSVERYYMDFVAYNCKSGHSLNGLPYCKKNSYRCVNLKKFMMSHTLHVSQSIAFLKMRSLRRGLIFKMDLWRAVHQWYWILTNG